MGGMIRLRSVKVQISFYKNGLLQDDPSLKPEDYLEAIALTANPSSGNSEAIENKIIAFKKLKSGNTVALGVKDYFFLDNAEFSLVAIPKGNLSSDLKIGLSVIGLKCNLQNTGEKTKISGLPFDGGTRQQVGLYGTAPRVTVRWTQDFGFGRAFIVESNVDVIVEKVFIKSDIDGIILTTINNQQDEYLCEKDDNNGFISCNFGGNGILVSVGEAFFCKNNNSILTPKTLKLWDIYVTADGRRLVVVKY